MKTRLSIALVSLTATVCGISASSLALADSKPALSCVEDGQFAISTFTIKDGKGQLVTRGKEAAFVARMDFECQPVLDADQPDLLKMHLWTCKQELAGVPDSELTTLNVFDKEGMVTAETVSPTGETHTMSGCTLN